MRGSQYENKLAIYLFKTRERETVLKFCAAFEEVILNEQGEWKLGLERVWLPPIAWNKVST